MLRKKAKDNGNFHCVFLFVDLFQDSCCNGCHHQAIRIFNKCICNIPEIFHNGSTVNTLPQFFLQKFGRVGYGVNHRQKRNILSRARLRPQAVEQLVLSGVWSTVGQLFYGCHDVCMFADRGIISKPSDRGESVASEWLNTDTSNKRWRSLLQASTCGSDVLCGPGVYRQNTTRDGVLIQAQQNFRRKRIT